MPFYPFYFDWTIIILIPAMIFAIYAQAKVQSNFSKYSKVHNSRGLTAAQVARQILDENGLTNVAVEHISGNLTDHFDPKTNVVRLSDSVMNSTSVAAIGVAAHECGHAIQHATGYFPIKVRTALVPITNIGSSISIFVILFGLLFGNSTLALFGVALFSLAAVFQAVTLPVEFNASSRALATLESRYMLDDDEIPGARKVLSAAALTYVAALVSSLATVLRLLLIVMGSRRRND